jgi:hypothetical protein
VTSAHRVSCNDIVLLPVGVDRWRERANQIADAR